ncbi:site-specific tyrosine recombinase XerC [Caulifigura coniformis]|uniref:Site-specific tyrosine recombinase XerC n=1 Tax=Caulifigura coniformis TaxID=2527983 RepID=A0A517SEY3_9PLAN|nr:site-specific tyrosine recombinase XerC [Caulifigura coniformis]
MASVSKQPNGGRVVQFVGSDRKRRSVRLGRVSSKMADSIRTRIELLDACNRTGQVPAPELLEWLAKLDDRFHGRLAAVGLVAHRAKKIKQAIGPFLDGYLKSRIDVGHATMTVWGQVVRNLKQHFGTDRDLATINAGEADAFRLFLVGQNLSSTTVARRLQFARQFFTAAQRAELCRINPFTDVRAKAISDPSRQVFVERETIARVLDCCDPTWRLLVTLSRYAGLRSPSETCSLRWADINWQANMMIVQSPKTAHHEGRGSRAVPIFSAIREELQAAFHRAPEGSVYVLESLRSRAMARGEWVNANLRTQFERIIRRAGVQVWPRLFHQLRSSCETELVRQFPVHIVAAWMGHTPRIAISHYLQITGADFAAAAAGRSAVDSTSGAGSDAEIVQSAVRPAAATLGQQPPRARFALENSEDWPPLASAGRYCTGVPVDRAGIEPATPGFSVLGYA